MKNYTFHSEFKTLITQILAALGNTLVKRIDENTGEVQDNIRVNLRYAPKSRTIHDLVNKNQHVQLPVMSLFPANLQFNADRAFNKIEGFSVQTQNLSSNYAHLPQPVPISFTLNLSFLSVFQMDLDQMLTNILSNFFPYVVISYPHPDTGHEIRCKVEWSKQVSIKTPLDIGPNVPYRIEADTSFQVEGWIFRNALNPQGIIHNIDLRYTAVSALFDNYDSLYSMEGQYVTDYFFISGRPQLKVVSPYVAVQNISGVIYQVYGDMFSSISGLYVSATPNVYLSSLYHFYNPLSASHNLSSVYTGFSAINLSSWNINSNNALSFTLPTPLASGFIDILAYNEAGWGRLTIDSIHPSFNPYVSGSSDYNSYIQIQPVYISGIKVL